MSGGLRERRHTDVPAGTPRSRDSAASGPKSIRALLDNKFVFAEFWRYQNGTNPEETWRSSFNAANRAAHKALGKQDTVTVLSIVLSRIYTLRNQLVHGGRARGSRRLTGCQAVARAPACGRAGRTASGAGEHSAAGRGGAR